MDSQSAGAPAEATHGPGAREHDALALNDADEIPDESPEDVGSATFDPASDSTAGSRTHVVWRLLATAGVLGGLYLIAVLTGADAWFRPDTLQAALLDAGIWGVLLFVGAFAVGALLQVPGLVFVGAAILVYGRFSGGMLALGGALVALSTTFWVVRGVGGKAGKKIRFAWIRRALDKLEAKPVRTVAILRLVTFLSPPVNYALALSSIRYRDYLVGSALGLLVPFVAVTTLADCFLLV